MLRCRYVVGSNRVLLMLKDGSQAWNVKDFLVQQDRCDVVTIEGKDYPGKGSPQVQRSTLNICAISVLYSCAVAVGASEDLKMVLYEFDYYYYYYYF